MSHMEERQNNVAKNINNLLDLGDAISSNEAMELEALFDYWSELDEINHPACIMY